MKCYPDRTSGGKKLRLGHDVNRRTDRQGDSYIPPNFFAGDITIKTEK